MKLGMDIMRVAAFLMRQGNLAKHREQLQVAGSLYTSIDTYVAKV
jgi:hypothetical protein